MSVTHIPANTEPPAQTSLMTLGVHACRAGRERPAPMRQTFAPRGDVTTDSASVCRSLLSAGQIIDWYIGNSLITKTLGNAFPLYSVCYDLIIIFLF